MATYKEIYLKAKRKYFQLLTIRKLYYHKPVPRLTNSQDLVRYINKPSSNRKIITNHKNEYRTIRKILICLKASQRGYWRRNPSETTTDDVPSIPLNLDPICDVLTAAKIAYVLGWNFQYHLFKWRFTCDVYGVIYLSGDDGDGIRHFAIVRDLTPAQLVLYRLVYLQFGIDLLVIDGDNPKLQVKKFLAKISHYDGYVYHGPDCHNVDLTLSQRSAVKNFLVAFQSNIRDHHIMYLQSVRHKSTSTILKVELVD